MFLVVSIVSVVPLIYGLLYFLIPKGNLLHEIVRIPVYLARSLAIDVSKLTEEKYSYGKHFRQYLLHIYPGSNLPERQQVVIYLHGGGWQFGKPEMFRSNAKVFTDQGYHVFCISYRRLPFNNFEAIHKDMSNGLTKVLQVMNEKGLAGKKICMGGMSAGAHLAAMLFYDRNNLQALGLHQNHFSGLFLCGAPLDLGQMQWTPSLYFLAGKMNNDSFKRANPIEYLPSEDEVPVLAFHGTRDGLVHYQAGATFAERLKKINAEIVEFHTIPDGTHLDASDWVRKDNWIRKKILKWLEEIEEAMNMEQ